MEHGCMEELTRFLVTDPMTSLFLRKTSSISSRRTVFSDWIDTNDSASLEIESIRLQGTYLAVHSSFYIHPL